MRVEWTEPALDDMIAIRDYIAEDSPENAYRFIERLFDAAEPLTDQPREMSVFNRSISLSGIRAIYGFLQKPVKILFDS